MVDSNGSRQDQTPQTSATDSGGMESLAEMFHRVGNQSNNRARLENLRARVENYVRLNHPSLVATLASSPWVSEFLQRIETEITAVRWQRMTQYIVQEMNHRDPGFRYRTELRAQMENPLDLNGERAREVLPQLPRTLKKLDTFLNRPAFPVVSRAEEATRAWLLGGPAVLTLVGPPGTGKTHLAEGAAAALVEKGKRVAYFTEPQLIEFLHRGIRDKTVGLRMDAVSMAEWLVLDDLGMPGWSDWDRGKIDELINRRGIDGLKTLITTNLLARDLPPRIASRISDRERAVVVSIDAADYRVHGR